MARTKRKINPVQPAPVSQEQRQRVYQTGGYIRLSVEDSGKPGSDTVDAQQDLIQEYIENQPDMQLYRLYCDNGRTGTNFDRPAFEELMEDVRTGKVNCIVVKDLSRFGRNYLETGKYLEQIFPFLGVRFVAVNDHFDTLTAERSNDGYIVPLKNIINAVYSKDISRKISSAFEIKRQNGDFIGSWAPYGYRKCADNPHRIEPNEETAPIVRDIFQWRLDGESCIQIARKLNQLGVPAPSRYLYNKGLVKAKRYRNSQWQQKAVRDILTGEVYLGHLVQGCKRSDIAQGKKHQRVPKSEWVIVRNTHEPLIEEEVFRKVQQITEEAHHAYYERLGKYDELGTTPNIFRGLIFCADCKRFLIRYKSVTNRGRNRYYVYICPSHSENPLSCPKKYLHETELKEVLWKTLRQQILLAENLQKLVQQYAKSAKAVRQESDADCEIAAVSQKLARAEMLYDSLYQNYVDHLMTEQEYMELKQQYRADMEQAKVRLAELKQQRKNRKCQMEYNPFLVACEQFQQETELTEEMLRDLVERIEVSADNHISVMLRYQDECRALIQMLEAEGIVVPA